MFSVCVVTVTYGNRVNLVKKMIDGALSSGVTKIFILDNGSDTKNSEELFNTCEKYNNVFVTRYNENHGSAGGFNRALRWARKESYCDFFWLLDDDNVPTPTALSALISLYNYLGQGSKNVLVSYRMILNPKTKSVEHKKVLFDSVRFGSIIDGHVGVRKKIHNFFSSKSSKDSLENYPVVPRKRASWGGMFTRSDVFDTVGYPNENLYLYADDFEFSDRLIREGFLIYTASRSIIVDMDAQFRSEGYFSPEQADFKIYYSLRNHIYIDHKNDFLWVFAFGTYIAARGLLKVGPSKIFFHRMRVIIKALKDGISGKLGKSNF